MALLVFKREVFAIMGAAIEVHRELGSGFYEGVYQEAFEIELVSRGIPFAPQKEVPVLYKKKPLKKHYVADLICFEKIIVEIKAQEKLTSKDQAQVINYLKATGLRVGLVTNFGSDGKLEWKRLVK